MIVLITGASSGLGLHIADYLQSRGHIVYGTSRKLQDHTGKFQMLQADVTDDESIRAAVARIIREQGRIDVLINNAGLGIAAPMETVAIADVQRVLDTNVVGVIRTMQAVLPQMRLQGSGLILNISSIGAEIGLPYRGVYSASKAAVDRMSEALRSELAPFGIQVSVIQPGAVKTEINKNRIRTELPSDNVYKKNYDLAYGLISQSIDQGQDPEAFGKLVHEILQQKKVKAVYRLGNRTEVLSVVLKTILPTSTFEKMIRKHYGLK